MIVLFLTVQKHREGADANGATHTQTTVSHIHLLTVFAHVVSTVIHKSCRVKPCRFLIRIVLHSAAPFAASDRTVS